jgi:hypothetical protein
LGRCHGQKNTVSGSDEWGDLQGFASDDPERALGVFADFSADLNDVVMSEPISLYQAAKD